MPEGGTSRFSIPWVVPSQLTLPNNPKIKVLYSHAIDEVLDVSQDKVTAVRAKDLKPRVRKPAGEFVFRDTFGAA